jgi:hypothetical protein
MFKFLGCLGLGILNSWLPIFDIVDHADSDVDTLEYELFEEAGVEAVDTDEEIF